MPHLSIRPGAAVEKCLYTKKLASFEIATLFTSLYGNEKSAAISKLAVFLVQSSCFDIALALVP